MSLIVSAAREPGLDAFTERMHSPLEKSYENG